MSEQNKSFFVSFFAKKAPRGAVSETPHGAVSEKSAFFFEKKKQKTFILFAAVASVLNLGWANAETLSVCIDKGSATASRDQAFVEKVAAKEKLTLDIQHFDSSGDDDGVSVKEFKNLLSTKCELLMGFPMEAAQGFTPPGLMTTKPYAQTGFVLVTQADSQAKSLADLPAGTHVAVTFETAPNLYFLEHTNIKPDVHETDAETLKALTDGKMPAAMVWQGTVQSYLDRNPAAHLKIIKLDEPHARWNIVALYSDHGAEAAKRFNEAITPFPAPISSDGFNPALVRRIALTDAKPAGDDPLPALYTESQATAGAQSYRKICAVCHGQNLQGIVGPALKGPNFASKKSNFAVGDIFVILANNMPASSPGSLDPKVYVQLMAYLLQQNGYPAGNTELTFAGANASNVPLVYHGP